MLVRYCDDPDPDAWLSTPTWDETPVMPPSCKPLSFYVNGPLTRPQAGPSRPEIEPRSIPPATYLPPPEKPKDLIDEWVIMVDGRRHIDLDGVLTPIFWEKHPGPQSVYPPAIPVPGLSKKTRGRSVPTKESGIRTGTTYTCKVEGCRKVFVRHEHLKRHVRSLHTHEKNYMCALPFCDKSFARRDNLLQHERKHKHYQAFFDCRENFDGELMPEYRPRPPNEVIGPIPSTTGKPSLSLPSTSVAPVSGFEGTGGDVAAATLHAEGRVDHGVLPVGENVFIGEFSSTVEGRSNSPLSVSTSPRSSVASTSRPGDAGHNPAAVTSSADVGVGHGIPAATEGAVIFSPARQEPRPGDASPAHETIETAEYM